MKTALFIAYECAPFHRPSSTIGAQRPFQFAKHLPKFGWQAVILCCDYKSRYTLDSNSDWKGIIRSLIDKALSNRKEGSSLTIPLPSFTHANWIDKIWLDSVEFNNTLGDFSAKAGVLNMVKRKISTAIKTYNGDHSESWQKIGIFASDYLVSKNVTFDVQVAFHSPDACLNICKSNFNKHQIKWVIDFRDPFLIRNSKLWRMLLTKIIVLHAKTASVIVSVSNSWAELDQKVFRGKPCFNIPNGFDPEDFNSKPELGSVNKLNLLYMGSVKKQQSFELLGLALQHLISLDPLNREKFAFCYCGPNTKRAEEVFLRFSDQLELHIYENLPRELAISKALGSDVLVLLSIVSNDFIFIDGVYPAKLFEYFGLNKPIIAIPSDYGAIDSLLKTANVGFSFDKMELLANYLLELYDLKMNNKPLLGNVDKEVIASFTRENQSKLLAEVLDGSLI